MVRWAILFSMAKENPKDEPYSVLKCRVGITGSRNNFHLRKISWRNLNPFAQMLRCSDKCQLPFIQTRTHPSRNSRNRSFTTHYTPFILLSLHHPLILIIHPNSISKQRLHHHNKAPQTPDSHPRFDRPIAWSPGSRNCAVGERGYLFR